MRPASVFYENRARASRMTAAKILHRCSG